MSDTLPAWTGAPWPEAGATRHCRLGGGEQRRETKPVRPRMTSQRSTRAAGANTPTDGAASSGVDKTPRRRNKKRAAKFLRPPLGALAAAARDLHAARPGGGLYAPRTGSAAEDPSQPDAEPLSQQASDSPAHPGGRATPRTAASTEKGPSSSYPLVDTPSEVPDAAAGTVDDTPSAAAVAVPTDAGTTASAPTAPDAAAVPAEVEPLVGEGKSPPAAPGPAGGTPSGSDASTCQQPAPSFWIDLARGLVELLTHSPG